MLDYIRNTDRCYIYLAAPFFDETQVMLVTAIEDMFYKYDIVLWPDFNSKLTFFSSRRTSETQSVLRALSINEFVDTGLQVSMFNNSCSELYVADLMIAVLDDEDPRVMFDIGYAYKRGIPIIGFTSGKYEIGLLITCGLKHIAVGLSDLEMYIRDLVSLFTS